MSGASPGRRLQPIPGQPPDLLALGPGCAFAPRCGRAQEACRLAVPPVEPDEGHEVACLFPLGRAVVPVEAARP